LNRNC